MLRAFARKLAAVLTAEERAESEAGRWPAWWANPPRVWAHWPETPVQRPDEQPPMPTKALLDRRYISSRAQFRSNRVMLRLQPHLKEICRRDGDIKDISSTKLCASGSS